MAVTSDCTLASLPPASHSPVLIRKYSAPFGPYQSTFPSPPDSVHALSHGGGSLLPMPPNYNEGSCWTLASLSSLNPSPLDIRSRKISVEVTKISLRMDGRWAQEKPYIIEKTWDEWLDVREKIVQRYPETEPVLPKLSKTHGFLESIFINSKRSNSAQSLNVKELNNFLSRLVTKCSKKVINSSIVQNFFQTDEMKAGVYQVQYTDDDLPPLRRAPINGEVSERDEDTSIASHLQAFRFPEPTTVQSHGPSIVNLKSQHPNLAPWHLAAPSDIETPSIHEKISPRYRGMRPTDPMTVINERVPPHGSAHEPQIVLAPSTKGRTLGPSSGLMAQKSRIQIRPSTAFTRINPAASLKRPNTTDSGLKHEAILNDAVISNLKSIPSTAAHPSSRRPSEILPAYSREAVTQKPSRPQLREFKSMQDMRGTAGNVKAFAKSSKNGLVESTRNNSVPAIGENPQNGTQVRSPPNPWRRHRRTPSDSSSSFGSSQLSLVSSVLSSPTVTPANSYSTLSQSVSNQRVPYKIASRRSVDSLGPKSIGCEDPVSLRLIYEPETARNIAHHTVPPLPFHSIPPHILGPTPIAARNSPPTPPKNQRRPHTSAENGKSVVSNPLTLKVTHPESNTNIILAIERGICSLQQIKSKIQNKLKLAADVDLDPNWKMKLIMVDQEEFLRRNEFGNWNVNYNVEDDGLKLVELVNGQSKNFSIKKITLRIS